MNGIDVSAWQGKIDWEKLKGKIDFAILKMGNIFQTQENNLDKYFERNYSECKRLGIPIGVYVYNYAKTTDRVLKGAEFIINNLKGKSLELPVYIDMEDEKIASLGKKRLTEICVEFNTQIEKAGFWAGVYANRNWYDNFLDKNEIKRRYTTWIAHYRVKQDKYKGEYDMLQFSSSGRLDGINGKVDVNIMYRDLISDIEKSKNKKETIRPSKFYPACNPKFTSIVDALKSIKVNSSFLNRKRLAYQNGIPHYNGTYEQNVILLNLLKKGKLRNG